MTDFKVQLRLRLDWSEMDVLGHVNNVSYFKYIQAARVNYWELCGMPAFNEISIGPVLLSTGCRFIKPLFYPGNITIYTCMEFIKNTSYGFHHKIINENNELAAEAHDVIVNYDFTHKINVPVSNEFRTIIKNIEGIEK